MPTYLLGVYLAVNAIRDAFVVVEGPDCSVMKTQFIQGNHDLLSTLTTVTGHHRVSCTMLHPEHLATRREASLIDVLSAVAGHPEVGGAWVVPMPMAALIGTDLGRLARDVATRTGKDVLALPCKSLSSDWLTGYDEALVSLARGLDLSGGSPRTDRVAIVGHLFDRNEADQIANVAELTRLLEALDLEVTSIWLSGGSWADLHAVRDAGTVIALPYGRRAALAVARATGAQVVDAGLPLGLAATETWLRTIAAATDRAQRVQTLLDTELGTIVPRLEWIVPHVLHGRRVGFVGDAHLALGLDGLLHEVGARLVFAAITQRPAGAASLAGKLAGDTHVLGWPTQRTLARFVAREIAGGVVDLVCTNAMGFPATRGTPVLELGFPSFFQHALYERPFLGFRGALALLDTVATTLRVAEATRGRDAAPLGRWMAE